MAEPPIYLALIDIESVNDPEDEDAGVVRVGPNGMA